MNVGFEQLHEEINTFKHEIEAEATAIKAVFTDFENAMDFTQSEVRGLSLKCSEERYGREELSEKLQDLERQVIKLRKELEKEKENVIKLEQYIRRETLIFHRIPEADMENCMETVKRIRQTFPFLGVLN